MGGVSIENSTAGVLLQPYVTGLSGSTYKYASSMIGGKKSKKSAKKSKKSAKKSRKSGKKSRKSRKTSKKLFPMLGF
jgi:hypothetical protein